MTESGPALEAEDRYRASLRDNRGRDAAAGRTLIGPHLSDLLVWHGPKQAPAAASSTGEQKALIVGLALAHARLVGEMSGIAPLALFDEIAAHFDPRRRAALFDALARLGGQVFLTGADPAVFAELNGRAEMFEVSAERGGGACGDRRARACKRSTRGRRRRTASLHRCRGSPAPDHICGRNSRSKMRPSVGGAGEPAVGEDLALELP